MADSVELPVIDLSSADRISTAESIRQCLDWVGSVWLKVLMLKLVCQACVEYGFFYLVNHGVEEELLKRVFDESRKFFSLPLEEKMKLERREHRGYTPLYAENFNPSLNSRGDSKETFYIGPIKGITVQSNLNQWPSEDSFDEVGMIESLQRKVEVQESMTAGKRLITLIALSLNLDERYFDKVGALDPPMAFVRLLHYPGELAISNEETCGASAHSDYGMVTLLATDGIRGLQACLI
ncbi:hypothetical protein HHK36_000924 [Tetracentron sinense]|uniref:Non-haem dioxygenase N-terminal domain-containing protein n=1 Tax=Tetracentron sinense TaxID=13715 RepID=A0A835DUG0_TETSI|nr:hypothetical protein HHK36_000924 [Tetracentron sinense]